MTDKIARQSLVATPPLAPQSYAIPRISFCVGGRACGKGTPGEQLANALMDATKLDIVLEDGVYDSHMYFTITRGHRLYARNLGEAVLRAGIVVSGQDGSGGSHIQGCRFEVDDPIGTAVLTTR